MARSQVFLLPVIIGDAVGNEADGLRHRRQRRAAHALLIEQARGGVEDCLALALKAPRRAVLDF